MYSYLFLKDLSLFDYDNLFCTFEPLKISIYDNIIQAKAENKKGIAVLVDPDDISEERCIHLARTAQETKISYFFVGGSLLTGDKLERVVLLLKEHCSIPILLFPGSHSHITSQADALLFLSLISGRNAEYLIGQHVLAAPSIKRSGLETIPTGYILIDSGLPTTVSYVSNTQHIPANKPEIAACTALAGELLGLKLFYLEAGSGAKNPVSKEMIVATRKAIAAPLIVGGGIKSLEAAQQAFEAGADIIVIGTAIEENASFLNELGKLAV